MASYGILTSGQLARFPVKSLKLRFGVIGEYIHQMALGIDESPVISLEQAGDVKSIGHSTTLDADTSDKEEICSHVMRLSEMVGRRARRHHYTGHTVTLTLRYSDFTTFPKRHSINQYINHGHDIYLVASQILKGIKLRQPVRLVGVCLSGLTKGKVQLELFEPWQKGTGIVEAMDDINDRYGEFTVAYGRLLHCRKHSRIISPSYRPEGPHKIDVV